MGCGDAGFEPAPCPTLQRGALARSATSLPVLRAHAKWAFHRIREQSSHSFVGAGGRADQTLGAGATLARDHADIEEAIAIETGQGRAYTLRIGAGRTDASVDAYLGVHLARSAEVAIVLGLARAILRTLAGVGVAAGLRPPVYRWLTFLIAADNLVPTDCAALAAGAGLPAWALGPIIDSVIAVVIAVVADLFRQRAALAAGVLYAIVGLTVAVVVEVVALLGLAGRAALAVPTSAA